MALVVLAIVASTVAGIGAERRWGDGARAVTARLLDVLLWVVMPLITFFVVARLQLTAGVGAGLAFGYLAAGAAGVLAWVAGERWLALERPATGAMVCAVMVSNTGYLGLPLAVTLLGADQLGPMIAYDVLVNGPLVYLAGFAVGAALGARAGATPRERLRSYVLRNPVAFALAAALIAPDALAPDVAVSTAEILAVGLLPVGFFVLGVNLMHEREDGALDFPPRMTAPAAVAIGLKLLVVPTVVIATSALIVGVPDAYLLAAAMPTGINTLLIAHVYGLDLRLAATIVAYSTTIVVLAAIVAAVIG